MSNKETKKLLELNEKARQDYLTAYENGDPVDLLWYLAGRSQMAEDIVEALLKKRVM